MFAVFIQAKVFIQFIKLFKMYKKLFRSNVWLFHRFHLVLIMGCDSITQITPSHMLEFLLLSGFFGLFNPSLSLSLTHTHALARTCTHLLALTLSPSLALSSTIFVSEVIKRPST